MQEVKVYRLALVAKITENRASHAKAYDEAMVGYRAAVEKAILKALRDHRKRKLTPYEAIYPLRKLDPPQSHLDEYDRLLAMLEMSVDSEITLAEHEFRQFVLDEWTWKREFIASTSAYAGR